MSQDDETWIACFKNDALRRLLKWCPGEPRPGLGLITTPRSFSIVRSMKNWMKDIVQNPDSVQVRHHKVWGEIALVAQEVLLEKQSLLAKVPAHVRPGPRGIGGAGFIPVVNPVFRKLKHKRAL